MLKFWKAIDGWKTALAAIYWPVYTQIVPIWFPNGMPDTWNKVAITAGIMLTIAGVGHKWYKSTHTEEGDVK
jgi:hypothetical protein